jgi:hypothetical protein
VVAGSTETATLAVAVPPGPVQLTSTLIEPADAFWISFWPDGPTAPVASPESVQELAALDVQLIVTTWFTSAFATSALISTVGAALVTVVELPDPLVPPPHADKTRKARIEEREKAYLCIYNLHFALKSEIFLFISKFYFNFYMPISNDLRNEK